MVREKNITRCHGDVEVAVARITRAMADDRGWSDEKSRRESIAELLASLSDLFGVEDKFVARATDLFGSGLREEEVLKTKRENILRCVHSLRSSDDVWKNLVRLRRELDHYTGLRWQLFQTYNGFLEPGTEGV